MKGKLTDTVSETGETSMVSPSWCVCRQSIGILVSALVILTAVWTCRETGTIRSAASPAQGEPAPTSTVTDSAGVFQKAFWKRPAAGDHILHAERREWADGGGVKRWQWFIAVEPSPELEKYLREDNAFMLSPAASVPAVTGAPDWFTFDPADVEILHSSGGNLRLFFNKTKRLLYATDAGGGFRACGPDPALPPTSPQTASTGRLPVTSPPNPNKP